MCLYMYAMSSTYVAICKPSLIPRLSPPPVVDHLQYAGMEGEVLGDLLMCCYVSRHTQDGGLTVVTLFHVKPSLAL